MYTPPPSIEATYSLGDKSLYYLPDPIHTETFPQSTIEKHNIPCILADGSEQFLDVYLACPDCTLNTYFIALHVSHSIVRRKALSECALFARGVHSTPGLTSIADPVWGMEHKDLLARSPSPAVLGRIGVRTGWYSWRGSSPPPRTKRHIRPWNMERHARILISIYVCSPSHSLDCDISGPKNPGTAHRLPVKFTVKESAKITRVLKALRFTLSELIDAASIVAAFQRNPVPADKVDTTRMNGASLRLLPIRRSFVEDFIPQAGSRLNARRWDTG